MEAQVNLDALGETAVLLIASPMTGTGREGVSEGGQRR